MVATEPRAARHAAKPSLVELRCVPEHVFESIVLEHGPLLQELGLLGAAGRSVPVRVPTTACTMAAVTS